MSTTLTFVVAGRRVAMSLSPETDAVLEKIAKARGISVNDALQALQPVKILEKGSFNDDTIREYLEEAYLRSGE